jgi:hypothetical protein
MKNSKAKITLEFFINKNFREIIFEVLPTTFQQLFLRKLDFDR